MAHHLPKNYVGSLIDQESLSSSGPRTSQSMPPAGDDEPTSDADEPPDCQIRFAKLTNSDPQYSTSTHGYITSPYLQHNGKESLLTQGLLTSPELTPSSDAEAPVLTSDGGLTSPARTTTPSPPLPTLTTTNLPTLISKEHPVSKREYPAEPFHSNLQVSGIKTSEETKIEESLGRRRCISFACGRQTSSFKNPEQSAQPSQNSDLCLKPADPQKRPCILKFACSMKPSRGGKRNIETSNHLIDHPENNLSSSKAALVSPVIELSVRENCKSNSTSNSGLVEAGTDDSHASHRRKSRAFNRVDFQESEATRFHEFAGSFNVEDEWTNEQTAYRQKITVDDTLRKENAIRKIGEEAEEEALEEDAEVREADDEDNEDDNDNDDDDHGGESDDEGVSDEGNESDNEEGFAESDDESDGGSEYRFWTPSLTTAATSTDHVEHIRPITQRAASASSTESILKSTNHGSSRGRKVSRLSKHPRMRLHTPDLPDSTDFVIGTLDEDRPLEEAYMSCLEERRRARHKVIPQDIDPSFPTSEPEDEDDDDEDEDNATQMDNELEWLLGRPDISDEDQPHVGRGSIKSVESPVPSPKRYHSPPPKRSMAHRSPPPARLFGQTTQRLRSPPPICRKITSPPSSRRPSVDGSLPGKIRKIEIPHLAQRPNLTHTTSLPRTPNPFWGQHRKSRFHTSDLPSAGTSPKTMRTRRVENHSRGPIDIVQGLETKRQRRKEKFWRQHCRNASREKERRCQPGKGAQRMKELGLEMADKCRAYGQRAELVLSV